MDTNTDNFKANNLSGQHFECQMCPLTDLAQYIWLHFFWKTPSKNRRDLPLKMLIKARQLVYLYWLLCTTSRGAT